MKISFSKHVIPSSGSVAIGFFEGEKFSKFSNSINSRSKDIISVAVKYHKFTGKKDLTEFCNKTFMTMNIEDDEDHGIKVRDEFKYNYLLNTNEKSKKEIFQELDVLFSKL